MQKREPLDQRFVVMLTASDLAAIKRHQEATGARSAAEATRDLMAAGFEALGLGKDAAR